MASFADELMADLEDDYSSSEEAAAGPSTSTLQADDEEMEDVTDTMRLPSGGTKPTESIDPEAVQAMQMGSVSAVASVAKLFGSRLMKDVLSRIDQYSVNPDPDLAGDAESPEYQLIVQANNLSVEIDNEILIVHKFMQDHYTTRFPELASLVSQPIPFCRVVLALGNAEELRGNLAGILASGAVMAVQVTAATSKGEVLDDKEWGIVEDAATMMFGLDDSKRKIMEYVESRISLLAPNISAIVGTSTATKILGVAGGLQGLSRIPHSNIYVLGAAKRASTGFSTASHSVDRLHTGFIYQCPLVQNTRPEHRMKAQRKVGAKVALAVRVDIAGSSPNGAFGEEMVVKLEKEMDRLARAAPIKVVKALPRPDEVKKARRGGKRARKAKEAYAMTDLRALQNRVKFGEAEEETGMEDETVGMGMIGTSSGKIRAGAGEARTKAKMSKMNKGRLASIKTSSSGTATSGLASSLSFTPLQGIELIDPGRVRAAATAIPDAQAKWFGDNGTFTHVKKEAGIGKPRI